METQVSKGIGEQLREAREERHLTLLEISDVIHLKVSYLEALERDDYSHLPVPIYTKNYIFKYANYLGLDGKALSERFQAQVGTEYLFPSNSVPASERNRNRGNSSRDEETEVMPRHWFLFALVVLGVIIALVKISGKIQRAKAAEKAQTAQTVSTPKDKNAEELMVIRGAKQEFNFGEKLPETE